MAKVDAKHLRSMADTNHGQHDADDQSAVPEHPEIRNTFRCRHIQGISLRNLLLPVDSDDGQRATEHIRHEVLSPTLSQIASDEEALSSGSEDDEKPYTNGAQNGKPPVVPSTKPGHDAVSKGLGVHKLRHPGLEPVRPAKATRRPKMTRQISRSMSTAFAEARQQVYEERIHSRRLDSFFSLHCLEASGEASSQPVYVSETIDKFMNPDFRAFMPDDIEDPSFLRGRTLAVRVWARPPEDESYSLLVEEKVALPELHFVTDELDYTAAQLRDNTILLHLPGGVYTSYTNNTFEENPCGQSAPKAPTSRSATFDTLMKLKKLVEVIDDATTTQETIKRQIEGILSKHSDHEIVARSASVRFSLQNIRDGSARIDRDIIKLKHDTEARRKLQKARKAAFDNARVKLKEESGRIPELETEMAATIEARAELRTPIKSHTARIAEDILYIFPIEPMAEAPSAASTPTSSRPSSASSHKRHPVSGLAFSIRGLHIPHASILAQTHPSRHEAEVAAALGYVGSIVTFLSRTLLLHIPFPIRVLGSQSVIRDDLTPDLDLISNRLLLPSQMRSRADEIASNSQDAALTGSALTGSMWDGSGARTFPLYTRNAEPARFRWAVYLLNKDIEELVSKSGLRVVDVRDTLANLRLLLVALAGGDKSANLPLREVGRVAGLHTQRTA